MRRKRFGLALVAVAAATSAQAHDATSLPLGDGHVSRSPKVGYVYSCGLAAGGGGAHRTGEWIHGDTWNPLDKPHVQGRIYWPDAVFDMQSVGDSVEVKGNGLPVGQPTGQFPIARNDPAYAYDRNPNTIRTQKLDVSIPRHPQKSASPGCLPMGMIGFTTTGVALYNALDAQGRDAAAHEVQDLCDGHPERSGQYHYHSASPCLPGAKNNTVVGWALDGYPILGMKDASGNQVINADLDACHGRAETVRVDGARYDYAYRLTAEYPYTLGCYTGQVRPETRNAVRTDRGPRRGLPAGQRRP